MSSMNTHDLIEEKDTYFRMMEKVPTQVYLGGALGSMGLSMLLRIFGFKDMALFVGQWAPTLLLMPLVHKLLRPSQEQGFSEGRQVVEQASQLISPQR